MFLWLIIAITVLFFVIYLVADTKKDWYVLPSIFLALFIIGLILSILFGIIAIDANTQLDAQISSNEQLYYSLVYQLENNIYDTDVGIGKWELYEAITDWNVKIARGKEIQDDFWFGIFYPNIYDQLEFINLNKY